MTGSQTEWVNAAIRQVAQEQEFYSVETEERLAREVEQPGNIALTILNQGGTLTPQQRTDLGYYLAVLLMRGPKKATDGPRDSTEGSQGYGCRYPLSIRNNSGRTRTEKQSERRFRKSHE